MAYRTGRALQDAELQNAELQNGDKRLQDGQSPTGLRHSILTTQYSILNYHAYRLL